MATVGTIYSLKTDGILLGQQVINQYHYAVIQPLSEDVVNGARQVIEGFLEQTWPVIRLCQSNLYTLNSVTAFNYALPSDWFERTGLALNGGVGGESLPPYSAWSFRYIRAAVGQRYGYKRIAGIAESHQSNGVVSSTGSTPVANTAIALGNLLVPHIDDEPQDGLLTPFVASRPLVLGTNPEGYGALGCQYRNITTQNTRKFGRGS